MSPEERRSTLKRRVEREERIFHRLSVLELESSDDDETDDSDGILTPPTYITVETAVDDGADYDGETTPRAESAAAAPFKEALPTPTKLLYFIKDLLGKTHTLKSGLGPESSLAELRICLAAASDVPPESQRLVLYGKELLEDEQTLDAAGVKPFMNVVKLVQKLHGAGEASSSNAPLSSIPLPAPP